MRPRHGEAECLRDPWRESFSRVVVTSLSQPTSTTMRKGNCCSRRCALSRSASFSANQTERGLASTSWETFASRCIVCRKSWFRNTSSFAKARKICDNVLAALKGSDCRHSLTLTARESWRDEDSIYLAGKQVVIVVDNDEIGWKHGEKIAASVHPYAVGIRIVKIARVEGSRRRKRLPGCWSLRRGAAAGTEGSGPVVPTFKNLQKLFACQHLPSLLRFRTRSIGWWTR